MSLYILWFTFILLIIAPMMEEWSLHGIIVMSSGRPAYSCVTTWLMPRLLAQGNVRNWPTKFAYDLTFVNSYMKIY